MMITVWGRATSVNVQAVMWALAELGIACERIDVGGAFGGLDTPEFRAMNPNGRIPVLRDGDAFLWESAAIVRYLGAQYGSASFWPSDPLSRAKLDKWAEWMKTSFGPELLTGVFWPLVGTRPEQRDGQAIAAAVQRLKPLAAMLDARLSEVDHLGGAQPCFADIVVGAHLYRYFTVDFERAETPHLEAYYGRLAERPAYAAHVMVSYESLRAK
jgi:glutathione S-transferase